MSVHSSLGLALMLALGCSSRGNVCSEGGGDFGGSTPGDISSSVATSGAGAGYSTVATSVGTGGGVTATATSTVAEPGTGSSFGDPVVTGVLHLLGSGVATGSGGTSSGSGGGGAPCE
jgi:hypothetical protein